MLTMSSFIYLHHMCGRGCHALPRAPLEEEGDAREGAWSSLSSSVPRSVLVPFQVSRLLPKCRVIGFALDAFPEGLTSLWCSVHVRIYRLKCVWVMVFNGEQSKSTYSHQNCMIFLYRTKFYNYLTFRHFHKYRVCFTYNIICINPLKILRAFAHQKCIASIQL